MSVRLVVADDLHLTRLRYPLIIAHLHQRVPAEVEGVQHALAHLVIRMPLVRVPVALRAPRLAAGPLKSTRDACADPVPLVVGESPRAGPG